MSRRKAFTLIELLVVVGIIVILVAILLPALALVRELAKSAVCLGNLREIGAASAAYSASYDGCTVPGYANLNVVVSYNGNDADGENFATTLVNGKYITIPKLNGINDPVSIGQNPFRCPTGTDDYLFCEFTEGNAASNVISIAPNGRQDALGARPLRTISQSTGIIVDVWYGINSNLDGTATGVTPCRRIPMAGSWALPQLRLIKNPGKMVYLFDGIFYNLQFDADRINARHNSKKNTNILFFDGHAESVVTANLPGGLGPNSTGTDLFSSAALGTNSPKWDWRLDQN